MRGNWVICNASRGQMAINLDLIVLIDFVSDGAYLKTVGGKMIRVDAAESRLLREAIGDTPPGGVPS